MKRCAAGICLVAGVFIIGVKSLCGCNGPATKAKANIGTLQALLSIYHQKVHAFPTEKEGLHALLNAGITEEEGLLTDPWGEPVRYRLPGFRSGDFFDLYSKGPDKIDGTPDDVGNWEEPAK
jgi:general secretion pathway protein G